MTAWTGIRDVARWEILRNLRNRTFLLGMLATPLIGLLAAGLPSLLALLDRPDTRVFAVVDRLDAYADLEALVPAGEIRLVPAGDAAAAEARVAGGELDGYLVLDEGVMRTGTVHLYVADDNLRVPGGLEAALTRMLQSRRLATVGLDLEDAERLLGPATVVRTVLGQDPGDAGMDPGRLPTAIGTLVVLMVLIMASGAMLLQSALQEKRDRMSEVILSSINAQQLMGGKILGHFLLGALQAAVWLAVGLPLARFVFDVSISRWIALEAIPLLVLFFLLGYLQYAALFVAAGATMEDIQSSSNLQGLVFMLPFLPFLMLGPVIGNPGGPIARVGTLFPLTSPFITVLRIGIGDVPAWEIAAAAVILLLAAVVSTYLAARVFRVGMLMYGKSASPAEIWRWLRTP
ncbi:MAG TPA: ABC transporter permease [Bacillota bacterium]